MKRRSRREAMARIAARDGLRCRYCGLRAGPQFGNMTLDHIVPRAKGGSDELGNLALACQPCNLAKADKLLSEWAEPISGRPGSLSARG